MSEKRGAIYISVESYYLDMIPEACYKDSQAAFPYVDIQIYKNNKLVDSFLRKPEFQPFWYTAQQSDYGIGDTFTISVQYDWNSQSVSRDYSVIVYAQQNIAILN